MTWTVAVIAYLSFAALTVESYDTAAKIWVGSAFVAVMVGLWLLLHLLHHHHRDR